MGIIILLAVLAIVVGAFLIVNLMQIKKAVQKGRDEGQL